MNEVYLYILIGFVGGYLFAKLLNNFSIAESHKAAAALTNLANKLDALNTSTSDNLFLQNIAARENLSTNEIPRRFQVASYNSKTINSLDKSTFSPGFNDRFLHLRSLVRLARDYFEETYNFPASLIKEWEYSNNNNFIKGDVIFYVALYKNYFGIDVSYEWLVNNNGLMPMER